MEADISKALSYEIKKELADRYFGFRTQIEQEKEALNTEVREYSLTLEQEIGHDLVRIYMMLRNEHLIDRFFELTGLNNKIFYDAYTFNSPTLKKREFTAVTTRGITRAGRFKRLLLNLYSNLEKHLEEHRTKVADLLLDHATIIEEIDLFYKKNDLSHMMSFLRSLDASSQPGHDLLMETPGLVSPESFDKKMRVLPPEPIEELLSIIPPVPPLSSVKKSLLKLAAEAYTLNKNDLPYDQH